MRAPISILVIEDDPPIRRFLRTSLGTQDYALHEADTGREGLALAASHQPDLILLDLGLPDLDGLEVLRQLREWSPLPVIVLSARGQERDKIAALDAGADDYLTKPFSVGELLARIRAHLRRRQQGAANAPLPHSVTFGPVRLDLDRRQIWRGETEVHLTPIEYKLLLTLVQHAGKVLTHQQLLREVWGSTHASQQHYPRVFMHALRRKLENDPTQPEFLVTESGVGYRLKIEMMD